MGLQVMIQSLTAAYGASVLPTGFNIARVVGTKPRLKSDPDMREVVIYKCFLSECFGANGLEPCEYLAEQERFLLATAKYMTRTGLSKSKVLAALVVTETEVKYLA